MDQLLQRFLSAQTGLDIAIWIYWNFSEFLQCNMVKPKFTNSTSLSTSSGEFLWAQGIELQLEMLTENGSRAWLLKNCDQESASYQQLRKLPVLGCQFT